MDTWIENLKNPLVLIGFMTFVFAGFIKLLLKNNIIKFNQANSAELVNKGLIFLFVLALVGMIFGFFSQKEVLQTIDDKAKQEDNAVKLPTTIKQATQGNNSATRIEKINLNDKNIDQNTKGKNSPAIISGGDAPVKPGN